MKHIVLIGFKSVGKTVIGKRLAKELGKTFLDLDIAVERKYGQDVGCRDIIAKEGEAYFRDLESGALADILNTKEPVVLALGGGAVQLPKNQALLRGNTVVYISSSPDILFDRIMRGGRPSFFPGGMSDREAFLKLYSERKPTYEKIATIKVQNNKGVESTAREIIKNLES